MQANFAAPNALTTSEAKWAMESVLTPLTTIDTHHTMTIAIMVVPLIMNIVTVNIAAVHFLVVGVVSFEQYEIVH